MSASMSMVRLMVGLGAVCVAAALSGCASPRFIGDPLASLSVPAPSASSSVNGSPGVPLTPTSDTANPLGVAGARFSNDLHASAKDTGDRSSAVNLWRSGSAFLSLTCSAYLDRVATGTQRLAFTRKETSLVGAFANTVLVATKTAANVIGGAAAVFDLALASTDAFSEIYYFTPAESSLSSLVAKAVNRYLDDAERFIGNGEVNFHTVIQLLVGQEELCRPGGIRRLVDEAVSGADISNVEKVTQEGQRSESAAEEVRQLLPKVAAAVGRPSISEADAVALYVAASERSGYDSAYVSGVVNRLGVGDANNQKVLGKDQASNLAEAFQSVQLLDSVVLARWAPYLSRVAMLPSKDAASATAPPMDRLRGEAINSPYSIERLTPRILIRAVPIR